MKGGVMDWSKTPVVGQSVGEGKSVMPFEIEAFIGGVAGIRAKDIPVERRMGILSKMFLAPLEPFVNAIGMRRLEDINRVVKKAAEDPCFNDSLRHVSSVNRVIEPFRFDTFFDGRGLEELSPPEVIEHKKQKGFVCYRLYLREDLQFVMVFENKPERDRPCISMKVLSDKEVEFLISIDEYWTEILHGIYTYMKSRLEKKQADLIPLEDVCGHLGDMARRLNLR